MKVFYPTQFVKCIVDFSKATNKVQVSKVPKLNEICIVRNTAFEESENFVYVTGAKAYTPKMPTHVFEAVKDCSGMKLLKSFLDNPHKIIQETAF